MVNIKRYSFVIVIISICSLISNSIVYVNYVKQQVVIKDIERFPPSLSKEKISDFDLTYPNINIYVVPFKTYIGRIYYRDSFYKKAIESYHSARKNNPFLMINENYLADLYKEINVKDSFEYYTKKAFINMPNHPAHFGRYLEIIDKNENTFEIDSIFNTLIHKSQLMWKIYLSSISGIERKSNLAKENFKIALESFPKNQGIELAIDYNVYGIDNVDKAKKYEQVSDALAKENKFSEAYDVIKKAALIHPYNKYHEKLATLAYKLELFQESLDHLKNINTKRFYDQGRYHLIKGVSLAKLDKKKSACEELTKAIFNSSKEAINAKRVFCK